VSILLPSLTKAKELAKQTVCLSNLKQNGLSMAMYAQEYDSYLPAYAVGPPGTGDLWYALLGKAGIQPHRDGVLVCPMNEWVFGQNIDDPSTNYAQPHPITYGFSYAKYRVNPPTCWNNPTTIDMILNPSDKFLLCDGYDFTVMTTDYLLYGSTFYTYEIARIHNEGTDVLYADNHAEWHSYEDVIDTDEAKFSRWFPDW